MKSIFRVVILFIVFSVLAVSSFSGYHYLYPGQKLVNGFIASSFVITIFFTLIVILRVVKAHSSEEGRISLRAESDFTYKALIGFKYIILALVSSFWWMDINQAAGLKYGGVSLFCLFIMTFKEFPNKGVVMFHDKFFVKFSFPIILLSSLSFI